MSKSVLVMNTSKYCALCILRSGVRIFTQLTENSEGITKINYGW